MVYHEIVSEIISLMISIFISFNLKMANTNISMQSFDNNRPVALSAQNVERDTTLMDEDRTNNAAGM